MLRFVLIAMCIPSVAAAETLDDHSAPFSPHANIGFELLGGEATSIGFRTHIGVDKAVGTGRVRPSLGVGGTFGLATLSIADARALDGTVNVGQFDWGPEVQLGLRWVDGGIVDTRLFASFAYLHVDLDDRLMLDPIAGVGGDRGLRASLGASWADAMGRAVDRDMRRGDKEGAYSWLMFLAPQQAELSWMRSAGSDRVGVTLSYGI